MGAEDLKLIRLRRALTAAASVTRHNALRRKVKSGKLEVKTNML